MNKHITFILGSLGRGGAEKVVSILSNDYSKRGWKVDIILLLFNNIDYNINKNVRIFDFTGKYKHRIANLPNWIKNIRSYMKQNRPDIILSFAARINIITYIASIGYTKKIFVSERNDPKKDGRTKLIDLATKYIYPKTNGVIFQTKRAKSYFQKVKNGIIIPNPIEVSTIANENKSKKIVAVGRLTKQKNHKMLINAFSRIIQEFPEYKLEIYGQGELKEELLNQVKELKLENSVYFMGNVSNIHECISDADVFVLSSDYEGLSNALLEAMMMGLPCISTNCAGSDEYVKNNENGILVPVNDEDLLSESIRKMLLDDEFRKKCGARARKDSYVYYKDNILNNWHNFMD